MSITRLYLSRPMRREGRRLDKERRTERERDAHRGDRGGGENELVVRGRGEGERKGGRASLKVELVVNRAVAKQPILFPLLRA